MRREHVGAHPVGQPMPDGPHVQFAVEGAEEPLDIGEVLVAQHHVIGGPGCRSGRLVRST